MPTLDSITEIRMGATMRGRDATRPVPEGRFRFLRIGDISQDGNFDQATLERVEPNEPISDSLVLREGDVLLPNRGTRTTALAFPGADAPTIVGSQFFILRGNRTKVWPEYLAWFLRSEAAHQHFEGRRKGSYVQIIQRKDVGELQMPLPPLVEQRKIVEIAHLAQQERILSEKLTNLRWRLANQQLLQAATSNPAI
jgi:restriction endonuclease S subunit